MPVFELDVELWRNVWKATQRTVTVAILFGAHWSLDKLQDYLFASFPQFAKFQETTQAMVMLAFFLIYGRLLFEIVTIFLPMPTRKDD